MKMTVPRQLSGEFDASVNLAVATADLFVRKSYLEVLEAADIIPAPKPLMAQSPGANLRLMRLDGIFYDRDEKLSTKIRCLFGAVERRSESLLLLLNGKRDRVELYLGVFCEDETAITTAGKELQNAINGVLPGCRYRPLKTREAERALRDIFPEPENGAPAERVHVSAVSAMPSNAQGDPWDEVEKLDALIDGMRHKPFSMALLAKAVPQASLDTMRQGLEKLYTEISPMQRQDRSYSISDSDSIGTNFSTAITESLSYGVTTTHGTSHTHGTGTGLSIGPDDSAVRKDKAIQGLLGAGAVAATILIPGFSAGKNVVSMAMPLMQGLFFGSGVANAIGNVGEALGISAKPERTSHSENEHDDFSESDSRADSKNQSDGTTWTTGGSNNKTRTRGQTMQMSVTNKAIADLLDRLDRQIQNLEKLEQEGAFEVAAYFIAGDGETAVSAANLYRSMTSSVRLPEHRSPIYHWQGEEDTTAMMDYLRRGEHPVFRFSGATGAPQIKVAQVIGMRDVPAYFTLPKRSVAGFVASEYAAFSRDIIVQNAGMFQQDARRVRIGSVYHLGKTDSCFPVEFRVDDLTKHLFVAGTTGVGKSNFCYNLLDRLEAQGISALVIEPTKGEYARVMGGRQGWRVFDVDPMRAPVLRVNPFAFPQSMSPVQHIERLMDIFNAAWPMYAAMPAILKEAIEKIYLDKDFDLVTGYRPENAQFPCFEELLEALPQVISDSAYSAENKGNYTGALVTRVRSLTNGIYGVIFGKDEVGDAALFDGSAVVDISHIGSAETKSLLMGVLVMRQMEYRMCSDRMNAPLTHVTVLEEAHHLLRAQNPTSAEGSGMRAASVEMISNAIAEMRTYGEGFVIADQSPSMMDQSAIRNTQTKVFYMLPEGSDRDIAGTSLSLSEEQRQELARLTTGVAAVFQTGWSDAVLCRIDHFRKEQERPYVHNAAATRVDSRTVLGQCIAVMMKPRLPGGQPSSVDDALVRRFAGMELSILGIKGILAKRVFDIYIEKGAWTADREEDMRCLDAMFDLNRTLDAQRDLKDIRMWAQAVEKKLSRLGRQNREETRAVIAMVLRDRVARKTEERRRYEDYIGWQHQQERREESGQ